VHLTGLLGGLEAERKLELRRRQLDVGQSDADAVPVGDRIGVGEFRRLPADRERAGRRAILRVRKARAQHEDHGGRK
jgi:hypothetical protein